MYSFMYGKFPEILDWAENYYSYQYSSQPYYGIRCTPTWRPYHMCPPSCTPESFGWMRQFYGQNPCSPITCAPGQPGHIIYPPVCHPSR